MSASDRSEPEQRVSRLLADASETPADGRSVAELALELAGALADLAELNQGPADRRRERLLARLMEDPAGQVFTTCLTDRVVRSADGDRVVDVANYLLDRLGVPAYLSAWERAQLRAMRLMGSLVPSLASAGLRRRIRSETHGLVMSAEPQQLLAHLAHRRAGGIEVNLNRLGEAVLGEGDAQRWTDQVADLLARPQVQAVSVKVSSLCSQVDLFAFDRSLQRLRPRLASLYRVALDCPYVDRHGRAVPKLVNLDMESYRDLEITAALFRSVLDEPEFRHLTGGMVLQAYLPDSHGMQRELTAWATRRVGAGGAPIRLRLVKGANLAAETALAADKGWALPIYGSKLEVDASFKRMVAYGCEPEHARAVHLGIATHNLFELSHAMVLRAARGVQAAVGFEMLEGMSDPLRRALCAVCDDVLLYCPVVEPDSMQAAIAYLMRRLDENTAEDNFLRHSFGMRRGDRVWQAQSRAYELACERVESVGEEPLRQQERSAPAPAPGDGPFVNESDTDFSRAHNRQWLRAALAGQQDAPPQDIPIQIGGEDLPGVAWVEGFDPSRPGTRVYRHGRADAGHIQRALACAEAAQAWWGQTSAHERSGLLARVAQALRQARGSLIAAMVMDAGKRPQEADTEVSEAVDFAEYYRRSYLELQALPGMALQPAGVTLITPPWNFPLAIPAGGVLAALMAGNAVILKPALEAVFVARRFAELCWSAGVSRQVLQFVVCEDEDGSALIRDPRVLKVVLTGASSTARLFQELRPGLDLMAETGGKNGLVVTAMADRDDAIADVLLSAFGHAGQKCSATSLLICEAPVYDDPMFMETLRDGAASLPVGSAWEPGTRVTPLIQPPAGPLLRAISQLDDGERWLLEPRVHADNRRLVSPGIKLGVQPGSFTHQTEFFGPVLGVMRARDLDHAIQLVNGTPYGLTSGLHSLDEREQARWLEAVEAGNLYVNRGTTGAIVRRQPFGGMKASCFGPGAKAGGPNYVMQLGRVVQPPLPAAEGPAGSVLTHWLTLITAVCPSAVAQRVCQAAGDYQRAIQDHFSRVHDPSQVLGERNVFRYRHRQGSWIRYGSGAELGDLLLVVTANLCLRGRARVSLEAGADLPGELAGELEVLVEDSQALAARVGSGQLSHLRWLGAASPAVQAAARQVGVTLADGRPTALGRVELLHYLREQSVTIRTHRHGYVGAARLSPALTADTFFTFAGI